MRVFISIFIASILQLNAQAQDSPLFEIEAIKPTAKPGDYVLCPSRQFFDNAVEKGVDKTTFIYYAAKLVESNDTTSTVKNLAGRTFSLPNQMIISIPQAQKAKKGDIVLTWWQKGSGMQRAIVVGGTESEPVVRYLDIKLTNPSGAGKRDETLRPNSFAVLSKPWQVGTTVQIRKGKPVKHGQLLAVSDKAVLVREFAGKIGCYPRETAKPLPIVPDLKENGAALAALYGTFKPVTVVKVDPAIGRVFAKFEFGRKPREEAFAFGDIY